MQHSLITVILTGLLVTSTGCALLPGTWGEAASSKSKSDHFTARDDDDPGLTPAQLRRSRNSIGEDDGFHWDHMQSSQARRIEQSLGLE